MLDPDKTDSFPLDPDFAFAGQKYCRCSDIPKVLRFFGFLWVVIQIVIPRNEHGWLVGKIGGGVEKVWRFCPVPLDLCHSRREVNALLLGEVCARGKACLREAEDSIPRRARGPGSAGGESDRQEAPRSPCAPLPLVRRRIVRRPTLRKGYFFNNGRWDVPWTSPKYGSQGRALKTRKDLEG